MKVLKVRTKKGWEHHGYFADKKVMKKYIKNHLKGVRRWRMSIKKVDGRATKPDYEA